MTTKDDQNKRDQIWHFVLEHEEFFCDPPPGGLGFPRPGMIPGHYLKHPDQWALDRIRVLRLKQEQQLRDGTGDRTASAGMAPSTRLLLEDIRRLAWEGIAPGDIAARLDVPEAGVRNVLTLGRDAGDQGGPGPLPAAGAGDIPHELGQDLAGRERKRQRAPLTAGRSSRSSSWTRRRAGAASSATPRHGPCTRSAPGVGTSAGTPASPTSPR